MSGWRRVSTADLIQDGVLEIGDGYRAKNAEFAPGGGLPFVRVGDVGTSTVRVDGTDELPNAERARYEPKVSRPGDSLITMKGTVGRVAFVPDDLRPFVYSPQLSYWRSHNPEVVYPRWLRYWLEGPEFVGQASATKGATDMADYINLRDQRRMWISLPPLRVQERIAEVLGAIDDLIEINRQRVVVLEELAAAIYREWFVHFRYPGHKAATLIDSPLGSIPEGWQVSTCGDELAAIGGGTPSKKEPAYWEDGTVPWFTPSDLTKNRCRFATDPELYITEVGVKRSSARRFPAGSVLMTSRATLGVLAIATAEATTNQGFIVIPPDARWAPGFLYEWLDDHADELASVATGATFKEITKGAFKRLPFLVPAQEVLDAHRQRTAAIEQLIHALELTTRNLTAVRDLLLPGLVTGRVDVSSLDLDELVEASVA